VLVEALALRGGAPDAEAPARRRWPAWIPWAAAALLVLGLGAAALLSVDGRTGPVSEQRALELAAGRLRSAHPDLFAGFEPLSEQERASVAPVRLRGPLAVLRPAETVLETRPQVTWVAGAGATGYEVTLSADGGPVVWRQTVAATTGATYPPAAAPLAPGGRYVVRVETRGPLGRDEATRRFAVADDAERARFTRALEVLASESSVLDAHFAIRRGLLLEAERLLTERIARRPLDSLAHDTLLYVQRRLGVPER
jgi:hypothetical protein